MGPFPPAPLPLLSPQFPGVPFLFCCQKTGTLFTLFCCVLPRSVVQSQQWEDREEKKVNWDLFPSLNVMLLIREGSFIPALGAYRPLLPSQSLSLNQRAFPGSHSVYAVVHLQFWGCIESMLSDTGGKKMINALLVWSSTPIHLLIFTFLIPQVTAS